MNCAQAAFPSWSRFSILDRHTILRKTADEILARKLELGEFLGREEGKTFASRLAAAQLATAGFKVELDCRTGHRTHDSSTGAQKALSFLKKTLL